MTEELFKNLPEGKYDIIYADPPWDYDNRVQHGGKGKGYTSGAGAFYNTLTLEQLRSFPMSTLCTNRSALFLWTTGPQLKRSIDLIHSWGFKYKTVAFVWEKLRVNPGAYTMSSSEYCLVATRGSIPKPRGARNVRQFLQIARTAHSSKPEEVRKRIEEMFPTQKKLELFARKEMEGWTCWGDQVEQTFAGLKFTDYPIWKPKEVTIASIKQWVLDIGPTCENLK